MTSVFEYGIVCDSKDAQRLRLILQQCFSSSPEDSEIYFQRIGLENFRCIRYAGQIVGGLAILQMGQWYGLKCVPMAGIAAVGIAPEYRGMGAAMELLRQTVREIYTQGVPISVLYGATQRPYRKVGYEQAGTSYGWEMPINSINLSDTFGGLGQRTLPMQPVIPVRHEVFEQVYHQQAKITNGFLARTHVIWDEIVVPPVYAYLIGEETQIEGYIIFRQRQVDNSNIIDIRDCALLTTAAIKRFWTFIADHRSQVEKVRWNDSVVDPLSLILPEQTAKIYRSGRWMLRIIDVGKALERRGYPEQLEAELHLDIRDDLLPENNGKFILIVLNGRGKVINGGRGELRVDINSLSPLYTGLFSPYQLQLTGALQATDSALSLAMQIFAGSAAWMPDFF